MKIWILAGALFTLTAVSQAQVNISSTFQQRPEFRDVPRDHWSYAAVQKAERWISPQEKPLPFDRPVTRYEFSVKIERLEDKLSEAAIPMAAYDVNSARDIVAALHREFQEELTRLRMRVDILEVRPWNSGALPPPVRLLPQPRVLHGNDLDYLRNQQKPQ